MTQCFLFSTNHAFNAVQYVSANKTKTYFLQVSKDGHVSLSTKRPAEPSYFMKGRWPNERYPEAADPPFIAPFYSANEYRIGGGDTNKLFFRDLTQAAGAAVSNGMLRHISNDIQKAVVGAFSFVAKHGVVVTWQNVPFAGCTICEGGAGPVSFIITFSLVLQ